MASVPAGYSQARGFAAVRSPNAPRRTSGHSVGLADLLRWLQSLVRSAVADDHEHRFLSELLVQGFAPGHDHGVVRGDDFTAGKALLALAGFWTVGVVMLVGSLYGSVGLDHFRSAPTCSPSQVFTSAYCRITLEATVTALTREHVVVDVSGREISPEVYLHGPLPDNVAGLPVRVTFYQGVAIHVEGGDLNFDTAAAPVDHVADLRTAGLFFLIGGTLLVGVNALIRFARRADFG